MVRALPDDGNRYETVHGELLVSQAPRGWHQEITLRLVIELRRYLERERVGHAVLSPADISWAADSLSLAQPPTSEPPPACRFPPPSSFPGSHNRASHPGPSVLFVSVSIPPCASAI